MCGYTHLAPLSLGNTSAFFSLQTFISLLVPASFSSYPSLGPPELSMEPLNNVFIDPSYWCLHFLTSLLKEASSSLSTLQNKQELIVATQDLYTSPSPSSFTTTLH